MVATMISVVVVTLGLLVADGAPTPTPTPTASESEGHSAPVVRESTTSSPTRAPQWHRPDLPHATATAASAKRIVSLAPVVTETIFMLDRGDRVVGVTRFCDRPAAATKIAKVGGYVDISLEKVLALKPDLVVAMPSLGQRELLDRLRERGVPVFVVFADSFAEVRSLTRALGEVLDAKPSATMLEERLDLAVSTLQSQHHAPARVAVVVGQDPLVVAGPGTFAAEAVRIAGLTLAVDDKAPMWPVWSPESLVAAKVDVIVAAEGPAARLSLQKLVDRALPSGKRPRVVVAERAILMRPGPALAEDLLTLGQLLLPDYPKPIGAVPVPAPGTVP